MAAFWDLADDPGGLTSDDAEARDDHVLGNDTSIDNANVILDDCELADDDTLPDMDVIPDRCGLDDRFRADEDMIANAQGHVGESSTARGKIAFSTRIMRQI
jgi:hypothetical protein